MKFFKFILFIVSIIYNIYLSCLFFYEKMSIIDIYNKEYLNIILLVFLGIILIFISKENKR